MDQWWQVNISHDNIKARSVAARFGRQGMPPPASNDTGTAFYFPN